MNNTTVGHFRPDGLREPELERISGCLRQAVSGRMAIALIQGEAGLGKTWLVQEARVRARELGFLVIEGAADQLDPARPFSAIAEAVAATPPCAAADRAALLALIQGGHPESPASALASTQHAVIESVTALIESLVRRQPVALVIEDLQWADRPTLLTLRAVAQRLGHLPIALLSTMRPAPRPADLERVLDDLGQRSATRVALQPLSPAEVRRLAGAVLAAPPGDALKRQLRGTGGNPLMVIELLNSLRREGAVTVIDGKAEATGGAHRSPQLRLTLLRSVSHLSSDALQVLRLATILGVRFAVDDLSSVSGRSAVELMPLVDEMLMAGVFEEVAGGRLAFRHELMWGAIYHDMASSLRLALHQQAAAALEAAGAPVPTVASQVAMGAEPGDARAVAWLCERARGAAGSAPSLALELSGCGLSLARPDDPYRPELLAIKVDALVSSGAMREAEAVIGEALRGPWLDGRQKLGLRLPLAWALISSGRFQEAFDALGPALHEAGADQGVKVAAAFARFQAGALDEASTLASSAVSAAEVDGDEATLVSGLCALSQIAHFEGRITVAEELATRAVERGAAGPSGRLRWPSNLYLATALIEADRFDEAHDAIWRGYEYSHSIGRTRILIEYQWKSAELKLIRGQWDDALAEIEAGFTLYAESEQVAWRGTDALAWQALIALHRNDFGAAQSALHAGDRQVSTRGRSVDTGHLDRVRALFEEARGELDQAVRTMESVWATGMVPLRVAAGPDLVRMLLVAGLRDRARTIAAGVAAAAGTMGSPTARAAALRCRGMVRRLPEPMVEAVGILRAAGRPLELASACEDAGRVLTAAGHRADGVVLFDEAVAGYEALGAIRDAARVRSQLRAHGVPRRRRSGRSVAGERFGWAGLTATEARVAELVVSGLTSPEIATRMFVSRRTVETHVAHVFGKLQIRSRAELRSAAASRTEGRPAPRRAARAAPATR